MLKNYLIVAFRNLRRHPGYAFINVFGLGVGMACCLLILLYVRHDSKTALTEPLSVVITERIAQKYFGDEDPVGRVLTVDNERAYTVTGVMKNLPAHSHLQFDFLASFATLDAIMGVGLEIWTYNPFFTYVLLPPGYDAETLNTKLATFIDNHVGEQLASIDWKMRAFLQPLSEIHLHPLANEQQGDMRYVYSLLLPYSSCSSPVSTSSISRRPALLRGRERSA